MASGNVNLENKIINPSKIISKLKLENSAIAKFILAGAMLIFLAVFVSAGNVEFKAGDFNITGNLIVDTNSLFVDSVNNRIGIGTTSPGYPLHVRSTAAFTAELHKAVSGGGTMLSLLHSTGTAAAPTQSAINHGSYIAFRGTDNATNPQLSAYIGTSFEAAVTSSSAPASLVFQTTPSGSVTPTEKLRITSAGNVGIGTTSPTTALDIIGALNVSSGKTWLSNLLVNGSVGIGTTNPTYPLEVAGAVGIDDFIYNNDDNTYFGFSGLDRFITVVGGNNTLDIINQAVVQDTFTINEGGEDWDFRIESYNQTYMFFIDAGINRIGIMDATPNQTLDVAGNIQGYSFITSSDRDLKANIQEYKNNFTDLNLKAYTYNLKHKTQEYDEATNTTIEKEVLWDTQLGLMQDEVPEVCRKGEGVDIYCLITINNVRIQALQDRVLILEAEVALLKGT